MAKDLIPSPTPLTPPHHEEDWFDWLRLLRSRRVGPSTFHRLLAEHGSAKAALQELPAIARAAGVKNYEICSEEQVRAELRAGKLAGARLLFIGNRDYPDILASLPDAPPILWTLGDTALLRRPLLALVGARNASSLGTRMARKLAKDLSAAGIAIVSGLARGIDTAAHMGALDGGTVAVMAGGVDVIYPAENATLAQEIAEKGLRISEQPMGLRPIARHFPQRNRIVSGLCRGVVVIEAAARSGSLITARAALDQGREVLAVPGHPFDGRATGCNHLIRDGATLVRGSDDVIEALGHRPTPNQELPPAEELALTHEPSTARTPAEPDVAKMPSNRRATSDLRVAANLHRDILNRLSPSPISEDQLIRDLNVRSPELAPALLNLELEGKITRQPGGMLSKAV